jgi:hypothetical protein
MNIPEQLLGLSKHLMLFLAAVVALCARPLFEATSAPARYLFFASLLLAMASFLAGYSAIFILLNDEANRVENPKSPPQPTRSARQKVQLQYILTTLALAMVITAIAVGLYR